MTSLAETAAILQQHEDASVRLDVAETISELQTDLRNTIALCSSIKSENADLKQQLRDANAFSAANLQRHAEWKEARKKEQESILKREKKLEREEAKLKVKLNERREEVERKQVLNIEAADGGVRLDHLKDIQAELASKTERLAQEVMIIRFLHNILISEPTITLLLDLYLRRQASGESNFMNPGRIMKNFKQNTMSYNRK